MKNTILYSLLLLITLSACAQDDKDRSVFETFRVSEYRADLTQIANGLKGYHPRIHEYVSKDSFNLIVNKKLASFTDSTTLGEFIWSAREISALVACGHTYIPTLSRKFKVDDQFIFPLYGQYVGDSFYVLGNKGNEDIPIGSEILSINNRSVSDIRSSIYSVLSGDGNNMSFKEQKVNNDFEFLCTYELNFPSAYTIEYKDKGDKLRTKVLKPLEFYDYDFYRPNGCPEHLCVDINEETSTATIRIGSFSFYNDDFPKFKNFIDGVFSRIRANKTENVIIDIRSNGGGDPYCASYLLQYIADKPFQYYKSDDFPYYKDLKKEIPLVDNAFEGNVYTITNGRCFSTSGHFLSLIKHYNIGEIIGRESGATYRCNANTTEINSRYTGVSCYSARATFSTIADEFAADRGIIPDHIVTYSKEDLVNGVDRDMEVVKGLIKRE